MSFMMMSSALVLGAGCDGTCVSRCFATLLLSRAHVLYSRSTKGTEAQRAAGHVCWHALRVSSSKAISYVLYLTISGWACGASQYPLCISMLAGKRADVLPMITHRFDFSAAGVAAGFDTATRSAATGAIKVMFSL